MRIYLPTDWIRLVYYDQLTNSLKRILRDYPDEQLKVLEYAECQGVIPQIIRQSRSMRLKLAPFPEYNFMEDLELDRLKQNHYDIVVADQVLEHVPRVWDAVWNCAGICKPGGLVIFGTPWLYPYHAAPKDYWRISLDGYKVLFREYGLEWVTGGGWGHQEALIYGNQQDAFLSAGRCVKCGDAKRGDPSDPCACGATKWAPNRTVAQAEEAGLFKHKNDMDHAIEVFAVGRKV